MATNQTTPARLWNRDFLLLWQGVAESKLGSVLYAIGIGVWVYDRTDSAALMGLMTERTTAARSVMAGLAGVARRRQGLLSGRRCMTGCVRTTPIQHR